MDKCSSCRLTPRNAVSTSCCSAIYCWECVANISKCVNCSQKINIEEVTNVTLVTCPRYGCKARFLKEKEKEHETVCQYVLISCPLDNLCGKYLRSEIGDHIQKDCPSRSIACPQEGCDETVPFKNLEEHLRNECGHTIVKCEKCSEQVKRKDQADHNKEACLLRQTPCPLGCPKEFPVLALEDHLKEDLATHLELLVKQNQKTAKEVKQLRMMLIVCVFLTWVKAHAFLFFALLFLIFTYIKKYHKNKASCVFPGFCKKKKNSVSSFEKPKAKASPKATRNQNNNLNENIINNVQEQRQALGQFKEKDQ
eukprot:TRINITY_DN4103_c0_g3_i2.p1 TRINITY_DN4103_c0_g3~~TRINITY_DN4103_c0_g3_i2.p1  ORF type:complete len:310 (+),score=96.78 TRINITY_DN4103_c0_g3_i2:109-1038(+)